MINQVGDFRCRPGDFSLLRLAVLFFLILAPKPAIAQFGIGLATELEYINNPQRLPESTDEDLLSSTTASVQLQRETQRIETALQYSANKLEYRDDHLADQSLVSGNGNIAWKILPDVLSWQVSNTRSNQVIDIALPDTTENRQVIDYTSTGPVLTLPVAGVNFVTFAADFSRVNYEESGLLDQRRDTYNLGLTRLIRSRLTASINSTFSQSNFDTFENFNYETYSLTAAARFTTEVYSLNAELGQHELKRAGIRSSNPLITLGATYEVNSRLDFALNYSELVQDLVSDLRSLDAVDTSLQGGNFGFGSRLGNSNSASLYKHKAASFGSTYTQSNRFTLALRYSDDRRIGIDAPDREQDERISSVLLIPISTRLSLSASAEISNLTASRFQGKQELTTLAFGASYLLTEDLRLTLSASDSRQHGGVGVINYESSNASLGLSYAYSR